MHDDFFDLEFSPEDLKTIELEEKKFQWKIDDPIHEMQLQLEQAKLENDKKQKEIEKLQKSVLTKQGEITIIRKNLVDMEFEVDKYKMAAIQMSQEQDSKIENAVQEYQKKVKKLETDLMFQSMSNITSVEVPTQSITQTDARPTKRMKHLTCSVATVTEPILPELVQTSNDEYFLRSAVEVYVGHVDRIDSILKLPFEECCKLLKLRLQYSDSLMSSKNSLDFLKKCKPRNPQVLDIFCLSPTFDVGDVWAYVSDSLECADLVVRCCVTLFTYLSTPARILQFIEEKSLLIKLISLTLDTDSREYINIHRVVLLLYSIALEKVNLVPILFPYQSIYSLCVIVNKIQMAECSTDELEYSRKLIELVVEVIYFLLVELDMRVDCDDFILHLIPVLLQLDGTEQVVKLLEKIENV